MQYCSLVNMESAESDVGLSGLHSVPHLTRLVTCSLSYSITWQDKVNKPLGPTSDSADYLFTKLQYYMTVQGEYCSLVNK
jgi:hypothetical protein